MIKKSIKDILAQEGYVSGEELLEEVSLFIALAKKEQYIAECEFFKKKYGKTIEEFEHSLHIQKGKEDFEKEEDLEDWEFAQNALKWWEEKIKELQGAQTA